MVKKIFGNPLFQSSEVSPEQRPWLSQTFESKKRQKKNMRWTIALDRGKTQLRNVNDQELRA